MRKRQTIADGAATAPGLTAVSLTACLFGLLAMGMLIQFSDITVGITFASEHTLALPAVWVLAALLAVNAVFVALWRWRVLSRAELLCVLFCMLLAAPLMSQGFWHRVVSVLATNPRAADFEKLDAMNDRLWPHGRNLLGEALARSNATLRTSGDCRWETVEYDAGRQAVLPVLVNTNVGATSWMRVRVRAGTDDRTSAVPGAPFIISVLTRATDLGPASRYYARVYADDGKAFTAFFSTDAPAKPTFLHRTGFRRAGAYGVKFPACAQGAYTVEFGLSGNGRVAWCDPKLYSVSALESLFKGKQQLSEREYQATPLEQRTDLIAKPDQMWSRRGAAYWLAGYIPVRDWAAPVAIWTLFVLLIVGATFATNVIMRRQWLDSERCQLPMARIPVALIDDADAPGRLFPAIWTNRLMWIGFAVSLAWLLLKAWHFYDPRVPDLAVSVMLQDYFRDPSWGQMWTKWRFEVEGVILALCMFMELNVLLSIVVGFVAYRALFWIGEMTGMTVDPGYPYPDAQGIGAYLGYALILVVLSRAYLLRTLRAAVLGDRVLGADGGGEALSYRGAYILLVAALGGSVAWAWWLGIAPGSMALFVTFLATIGFVSARLRAECGTPWGYFTPFNMALFLGLLGGVWRFGSEAMIFAYIVSFMVAPTVFFLIPGAQMELLGLGRRWNVTPRHLAYCAALGVLGGMVIGGWVFLSNAYALGGNASRYQWAFDSKSWYFSAYNQDLSVANSRLFGLHGAATGGAQPAWIACGAAAAVAAGLALLRQFFAGFWFHPIGFILGSTSFMGYVWGNALTAWVVRLTVVRLGGAATVREKLQPFFVGVFLGTCTGYLLILIHGAWLQAHGFSSLYSILTP